MAAKKSKSKAQGKGKLTKKGPIERLVFFGTPEFAVPSLEALVEAGRKPLLVVSQPARPAGRGKKVQEPPVAEVARELEIEVAQPERVGDEAFLKTLEKLAPDLAVVVAFGQIFPAELLALPARGTINVHASLLPKYRGATPIQAAIAEGEKRTGVTIMEIEEELDAGPILAQEETFITRVDTTGSLSTRLADLGAELLVQTLDELEQGKIKPRKQRDESASYAARLSKRAAQVDWNMPAEEIFNRLRANTPQPGLKTSLRGRPVKLVWGTPIHWEHAPIGTTGTFLGMRQGRLAVLCGEDSVFGIDELQRPGKKPVRALDFLNGERLRIGEMFA